MDAVPQPSPPLLVRTAACGAIRTAPKCPRRQQSVNSLQYLLTDPGQPDILLFASGWWGSDAIRPTTSARVHHVSRRSGRRLAARGARRPASTPGTRLVRKMRTRLLQNLRADAQLARRWMSSLWLAVVVGRVYALSAKMSLALLTPEGVAEFWPAAGVAAGAVIAFGRKVELAADAMAMFADTLDQ